MFPLIDLSIFLKGTESISDYAISFHYVDPKKMYMLEFYLYHLRLSEQQKVIENTRWLQTVQETSHLSEKLSLENQATEILIQCSSRHFTN